MKSKYLVLITILIGAFLWLAPVSNGQAAGKASMSMARSAGNGQARANRGRKVNPSPNAKCAAGKMNCVTNADRQSRRSPLCGNPQGKAANRVASP